VASVVGGGVITDSRKKKISRYDCRSTGHMNIRAHERAAVAVSTAESYVRFAWSGLLYAGPARPLAVASQDAVPGTGPRRDRQRASSKVL
jgi:hypothetical protein